MNMRLLSCLALLTAACHPQASDSQPLECGTASMYSADYQDALWSFAKLRGGALDRYLEHHPKVGVERGLWQFQVAVRDLSAPGLEVERRSLVGDLDRLAAIPAYMFEAPRWPDEIAANEGLEVLEYETLVTTLHGALFELERRGPWQDPSVYLSELDLRPRLRNGDLDAQADAIVAIAAAAPALIDAARKNLEPELARPLIDRALLQIAADLELIEQQHALAEAATTRAALVSLAAELRGYQGFLRERLASAHGTISWGPQRLEQMLSRTEGIRVDLLELATLAQADLERHRALLETTAVQVDPEATLGDLLHEVDAEPGPDPAEHCSDSPSDVLHALARRTTRDGWLLLVDEAEAERSDDPRRRLAQLRRALIHDVRLLAVLGVHGRRMSIDEATELFMRDAVLDESRARAEALDVAADPRVALPAIARFELIELRDEFVTRSPVPGSETQFVQVMRQLCGAPLGGLRATLVGVDRPA
jgi:hypothetical protein